MKRKEFTDLKTKQIKDLLKMVSAKTLEADKKQMEVSGGKEKNLRSVKNLRKDIARILTLIKEKQIIETLEKGVNK